MTAPSIAYLSFSSGEYDARTLRMARSAVEAGWRVRVYARLERDLPAVEERDGYRVIRVRASGRATLPLGRRPTAAGPGAAAGGLPSPMAAPAMERDSEDPTEVGRLRRWRRNLSSFPLRPLGWARALAEVAEPADLWHGLWAGSLPALDRLRSRHGGRSIYDSRDVYMLSRDWARLEWPLRPIVRGLERRWAHRADRVITVNEAYARILEERLGVARPAVVMNCPAAWDPPTPAPDLIRSALGLPAATSIALYQGQLITDRGIEQAMDAILAVPDAVLVLLGFGPMTETYRRRAGESPYRGRVHVLPAVPPDALLGWTASADVSLIPIQPNTTNHTYSTPQKLFESLAAGVPVVASDLPGMAPIVRGEGIGELCDPTSPTSIAAGLRVVLGAMPAERAALRAHVLEVAHARYTWEAQARTLFGVYEELLTRRG